MPLRSGVKNDRSYYILLEVLCNIELYKTSHIRYTTGVARFLNGLYVISIRNYSNKLTYEFRNKIKQTRSAELYEAPS